MIKHFHTQLKNHPHRHIILPLTLIAAVLFFLMLSRLWGAMLIRYRTNAQAVPVVNVVLARKIAYEEEIVLPATISAWHEAPIYARTNGYVKQWNVDIGDKVKAGDVLATIETPELDNQLKQAEADLNAAIAKNELAQITAERWKNLVKTDSVSKQEKDEKVDAARAAEAFVAAARANRDRLRDLVGFEQVIAPFSGVISDRATDIGDLINAGNQPALKPLFRLVQTDPLRIYVKIPEPYSSRIKPNMTAQLTLAEFPGQTFQAKLFQTAGAIQTTTRTLLAQFIIDNKSGLLLPGSYTQIHLKIKRPETTIRLPVNTLLFQSEGLQVAILKHENEVELRSIKIARDLGEEVEIDSGVNPGEKIIINPDDSIFNGQHVRLVKR